MKITIKLYNILYTIMKISCLSEVSIKVVYISGLSLLSSVVGECQTKIGKYSNYLMIVNV